LGIPGSLAELGVTLRDPQIIGQEAARDPCAASNPRPTDAAGYTRIFRCAVTGDLSLAE
jgi:alcohol dehydrogenase class IV